MLKPLLWNQTNSICSKGTAGVQTINTLFGNTSINENVLIHKFLINSWISYCKGNTSILALQNIIYKTINDLSSQPPITNVVDI